MSGPLPSALHAASPLITTTTPFGLMIMVVFHQSTLQSSEGEGLTQVPHFTNDGRGLRTQAWCTPKTVPPGFIEPEDTRPCRWGIRPFFHTPGPCPARVGCRSSSCCALGRAESSPFAPMVSLSLQIWLPTLLLLQ